MLLIRVACDSSRNAPNRQNVSKTNNIMKLLLEEELESVSPECKQETADNSSEE
jgi:hypothetical protein